MKPQEWELRDGHGEGRGGGAVGNAALGQVSFHRMQVRPDRKRANIWPEDIKEHGSRAVF